ncbi:hypothetical protein, partial [Flavobacterium sp. HJJ]|uniref:hypothetical protein n=1 Tax=Flavobacterium sp. HJJ TaxID=2783792 RepID=UPI001E64D88C
RQHDKLHGETNRGSKYEIKVIARNEANTRSPKSSQLRKVNRLSVLFLNIFKKRKGNKSLPTFS